MIGWPMTDTSGLTGSTAAAHGPLFDKTSCLFINAQPLVSSHFVPASQTHPFDPAKTQPQNSKTTPQPDAHSTQRKDIQSLMATVWPSTHEEQDALKENSVVFNTSVQRAKHDIPYISPAIIRTKPATSTEQHLKTTHTSLDRHPLNLPTPVKANRLLHHLTNIGYDTQLTQYLVDGFSFGFPIGHEADIGESNHCSNSQNATDSAHIVQEKLDKELRLDRIAGPFDTPPYAPFHISPLNIREKKTPGKFRLLHNLSFPYNSTSINSRIAQKEKTVKYATVGTAIRKLLSLPRGAYTAKTDIAEAFRLIPVHPTNYPKLGMKFQGKYYYDKCLPMGCGSLCCIFETFSTAVQTILEAMDPKICCIHMIDDFFIMADNQETCAQHLQLLLTLCADLGIPIAKDKTFMPAQNTAFLGVELDTVRQVARLPLDKLQEYKTSVQETLLRTKITRRDLESLVGKLNFATSVVPARPFLRRIIDLIWTVDKPYHFILITRAVKKDLHTWLQFLSSYNGTTYFRCLRIVNSSAIHLGSDASKLGFGACYGSKWVQAAYPPAWQRQHITYLELYPIYVLIFMFGRLMANSTIIFHCDNSAVTVIVNKQSSKDSDIMGIIRPLVLLLVKHNIHLTSEHIPGLLNILPDRISRFQVTPKLLQEYGMEPTPIPLPKPLLPENFKAS